MVEALGFYKVESVDLPIGWDCLEVQDFGMNCTHKRRPACVSIAHKPWRVHQNGALPITSFERFTVWV